MSVDERGRVRGRGGRLRRFARGVLGALGPTERSILTREGFFYFLVSLALLVTGLIQQVNLILLVFTLAAGPFLASIFGGRADAAAAQRGAPGAGVRLLRRSAGPRLRPGERPAVVPGAGDVRRGLAGPGRSHGPGRDGHHAPRVLPPGAGPAAHAAPVAVPEPAAGPVPVPRPGHRHAIALRHRRASRHDRRWPTRSWSIPGSAS